MLFTTVEELKQFLPAYAGEHIDQMAGFIDNSEHDFLMPYIGHALYEIVCAAYDGIYDKRTLLAASDKLAPKARIVTLCQRCAAFDAYRRSIDVNAVSVHDSGVNMLTSGDYDSANRDSIKAFKEACNKEAHAAANRLLLQLERWAMETASFPYGHEATDEEQEMVEIVTAWKDSRCYTLADGLLINTATEFDKYVSIYESRERFVELMPDLRYCQELWMRSELGDTLMDAMVEHKRTGCASIDDEASKAKHRQVLAYLTASLAFAVEGRAKMFEVRKERPPFARDESRQLLRQAVEVMKSNAGLFPEADGAPFMPATVDGGEAETRLTEADSDSERWENNREGNAMFVMPGMFR